MRWSQDEEDRLKDALRLFGYGNWAPISDHVQTRTKLQCKNRAHHMKTYNMLSDIIPNDLQPPVQEYHTLSTGSRKRKATSYADKESDVDSEDGASETISSEIEVESDQEIDILAAPKPPLDIDNLKQQAILAAQNQKWLSPEEVWKAFVPLPSRIRAKLAKQFNLNFESFLRPFKQSRTSASSSDFELLSLPTSQKLELEHETWTTPFHVQMTPECQFLIHLHALLNEKEIIGVIGGHLDQNSSCLILRAVFPCHPPTQSNSETSQPIVHSSHIQCEIDAIQALEAVEFFAQMNDGLVGWYHSHPTFKATPSRRDIETQESWQCQYDRNNGEPFVGIICGFEKERMWKYDNDAEVFDKMWETEWNVNHVAQVDGKRIPYSPDILIESQVKTVKVEAQKERKLWWECLEKIVETGRKLIVSTKRWKKIETVVADAFLESNETLYQNILSLLARNVTILPE